MVDRPGQAMLPTRNFAGWFVIAVVFLLLIPSTILQSYKNSDPNSKEPDVQAGNLESAVETKTKKDPNTAEIARVLAAMTPKHSTDEDADAVYCVAKAELGQPVTLDDVKALSNSKVPRRRALATVLTAPATPDLRVLANSLPKEMFLYKLARAQALEKLGDNSPRDELSPGLAPTKVDAREPIYFVLGTLLLLAGFGAIFSYVALHAGGSLKWQGHPVEPQSLVDADRLALRAAQFLGIFIFASLGVETLGQFIPGDRTDARAMAESVAASAVMLVATLLLCRVPVMGKILSLESFGINRQRIWKSLGWGVAGVFAVVPVIVVGSSIGYLFKGVSPRPDHPLSHLLSDSNSWPIVVAALFMASIQAPVVEELLFRGTLLPALSGLFRRNKYHVPIAITVSSLMFASIHPQGFVLWLPIAGIGVVNSVLCYQTRSVLPGMFMHGMYNGALLLMTVMYR